LKKYRFFFDFLAKISIFDQQKFRFLSKISIFVKNFVSLFSTLDSDDSENLTLLTKDVTGCQTLHPLMAGMSPEPEEFDPANPEVHPHIAYELNGKAVGNIVTG